eukprot:9126306-Pyramimonas_sp.AAC.1
MGEVQGGRGRMRAEGRGGGREMGEGSTTRRLLSCGPQEDNRSACSSGVLTPVSTANTGMLRA